MADSRKATVIRKVLPDGTKTTSACFYLGENTNLLSPDKRNTGVILEWVSFFRTGESGSFSCETETAKVESKGRVSRANPSQFHPIKEKKETKGF